MQEKMYRIKAIFFLLYISITAANASALGEEARGNASAWGEEARGNASAWGEEARGNASAWGEEARGDASAWGEEARELLQRFELRFNELDTLLQGTRFHLPTNRLRTPINPADTGGSEAAAEASGTEAGEAAAQIGAETGSGEAAAEASGTETGEAAAEASGTETGEAAAQIGAETGGSEAAAQIGAETGGSEAGAAQIGAETGGSEATAEAGGEAADSAWSRALDNRVKAETALFKGRTGLEVTGQTYYRLDEGLGFDDDYAVSRYNGKVQAELRWSPFRSALFKRRGRVNEIRIKGEIDRVEYERDRLGVSVVRQRECSKQRYDSLLCGILLHRITNLTLLSQAHGYLLRNESVSSDELLDILNEKAEAERKLMGLGGGYGAAGDLSCPAASVVRVDTARLLRQVGERYAELKALGLRRELLDQQEANASYWNDAEIAPFVRYSYYIRSTLPNSSNFDAGVSFKFPLSAESRREKRAIRARRALLEEERGRYVGEVGEEVAYILDDIERLNRSVAGEYRRCRELRGYLKARGAAYANRIGEYSRLARMKEYNSYLLCLEKMVEYQYERDIRVAGLARYLDGGPVGEFCHEEMITD